MVGYKSKDSLIQNLKDAGCDPEVIARFLDYQNKGKRKEQIKMLTKYRRELLNKVHQEQKRIDCLDYLIYQIEKGSVE